MTDTPEPQKSSDSSATPSAAPAATPAAAVPAATAPATTPSAEAAHPVHAKKKSLWPYLVLALAVVWVVDAGLMAYQIKTDGLPLPVERGCWVLTILAGLGTLGMLWRWHLYLSAKYRDSEVSEILIYSYPKLVYVWPVILLGFAFYWPIDRFHWMSSTTEAWIYVAALSTVFLTVSIDLNRVASLLWLAVLTIIVLAVVIVKLEFGVTFLDRIGHWIKELSPTYSVSSGLALSIVLGVFYVAMIIGARLNDLWFISHNQFEHRTVLGKDDSLARGAKRVKASYPDILELLLLGSGTLTVYSAQGNSVLASIENIPWLFFRMGRIDRILEAFEVSPQRGGIADDESDAHGSNEEVTGDHI
jgi:hypothetical protein